MQSTTASSNTHQSAMQIISKNKLTLAACIFSVFSFAISINLVPTLFVPLQVYYGMNFNALGIIVVVSFASQTIVLFAARKLPDKIGMRPMFLATGFLSFLGFVLLFLAPYMFRPSAMLVGIMIPAVVYGVGSGFVVTLVNTTINSMPFSNKGKTLSIFHALFALLILIAIVGTTLLIHFLTVANWQFLPLIWALIPLIGFILWIKAPVYQPKVEKEKTVDDVSAEELNSDQTQALSEKETTDLKTASALLSNNDSVKKGNRKLFWLLLVSAMVAMSSEAILAKGASSYIDAGLAVPKLLGDLLGPAMFAGGLGLGRLLYGLLGEGRSMRKFMVWGSFACFMLYLLAVFTPVPWLGVAAIALSGFAVSLLVPGVLAQAGTDFKHMGAKIFVIVATATKIGAAGAPALFGFLGDAFSVPLTNLGYSLGLSPQAVALRAALLICAIFPLASFIIQLALKRNDKKKFLKVAE